MKITSQSPDSDTMSKNSGKTVSDIVNIVNYALGRMRRERTITDSEAEDLRQDGYIAALEANRSYDPARAAWSTWVLMRINGQLRTSLSRLRNGGITGSQSPAKPGHIAITGTTEWDKDDEEPDHEIDIAAQDATDEAADTASLMEVIGDCVSDRSKQILALYYGLNGDSSLSTSQLAKRLGFSKKHAFSLLQKAQNEARACLGNS